ncbi:MAG TPA: Gfo/Idh/MocA family oxidoreductase, partial [Verrucomicrobia bacterium]|nr:Gfo/Idh/MocA family oxidoreductase [Verrucomicrobiota bacterium]
DAVFSATPDHWHAPATLLACQAGKHVYVEKPCSHNVREGRLMIEAGRQYDRVIEVAAQSRSARYVKRAIELLHDGAIGEILTAKAWNSQRRRGIGKTQPSEAPSHLDFDAWLGSAPKVEYRGNMLHSVWRWWFDYGAGDFGNDGVHDIDIARWGLNMDSAPVRMAAMGGKYFFDDDQQFPDTQNVLFEYLPEKKTGRPRPLMFEQRIWSPYVQEGHENGNAFYGMDGMMIFGKSRGWKLFGPRNELREEMTGSLDVETHHQDFFDAIQLNRKPSAGIETGHYSATLCHLGNIAVRTSGFLEFDPEKERVLNSPSADGMLSRRYREHWATPAGG